MLFKYSCCPRRDAFALSLVFTICMILSCGIQACSPSLFSPLSELQQVNGRRFSHVFLAEVIGIRAARRLAELEAWQAENELNALELERFRQEQATSKQNHHPKLPGEPPVPPPESPPPPPVLLMTSDLALELELFVIEPIHDQTGQGALGKRITIFAGGPCGNVPSVGESVLVFWGDQVTPQFIRRKIGPVAFDDTYLAQIRQCLAGNCTR